MKKKQPIGDILLELEVVLDKMYDQGMQLGDVLGIVLLQTQAHRQDAIEEYEDGSHPILKYGHKDQV